MISSLFMLVSTLVNLPFPSLPFPSHQISKPFHLPDGESDLEVIRRNKEGGSRADSIDGLTDGSTDQSTDNEEEQWIENESEEKKKKRDLVAEKKRKSGFDKLKRNQYN